MPLPVGLNRHLEKNVDETISDVSIFAKALTVEDKVMNCPLRNSRLDGGFPSRGEPRRAC